ncbi:MAG: RNA polymerase sigma factor [Rikenellaceae bacterium]|nr:RNA polymerase sigma factor [Rikenellaceae bacterium]
MTTEEYNKCVDTYSDSVYRFALKTLRDEEAAKDVVQESYLRLWENRKNVIKSKEKSYLFTIAYRLTIDKIRYSKKFTDDKLLQNIRNNSGAEYDNTGEILLSALNELSPQQRNLILLRDYEGYSYKEIKEITGLSESQVKVYIFRTRLLLKKKLDNLVR